MTICFIQAEWFENGSERLPCDVILRDTEELFMEGEN